MRIHIRALCALAVTTLCACQGNVYVDKSDRPVTTTLRERTWKPPAKQVESDSGALKRIPYSAEERLKRNEEAKALLERGKELAKTDLEQASTVLRQAYDRAYARSTAEAALFLSAEAAYDLRNLRTAYARYVLLLEYFPQTNQYATVLERIFNIGKLALEQGSNDGGFLASFRESDEEFGIRILEKFSKQYDRHPLADDALYLVGIQQKEDREYDKAIETWKSMQIYYPESEWTGIADLRIAQAQLDLSKDVERDKVPLRKALKGLRDFVRKNSKGDNALEAKKTLLRLEERLAQFNLSVAVYYLSIDEFKAYEIYLEHILREFPKTDTASTAKSKLEDYRKNPPTPSSLRWAR